MPVITFSGLGAVALIMPIIVVMPEVVARENMCGWAVCFLLAQMCRSGSLCACGGREGGGNDIMSRDRNFNQDLIS